MSGFASLVASPDVGLCSQIVEVGVTSTSCSSSTDAGRDSIFAGSGAEVAGATAGTLFVLELMGGLTSGDLLAQRSEGEKLETLGIKLRRGRRI